MLNCWWYFNINFVSMTLTISDSFKALFQPFNFMSSGNSCSVELSMKKVNNFGG